MNIIQFILPALLCCKIATSLVINKRKCNNLAMVRDVTDSCTSQLNNSIFLSPMGISSSAAILISANFRKKQFTNCKIFITTEGKLGNYKSQLAKNNEPEIIEAPNNESTSRIIVAVEFLAYANITNQDINFCSTLRGRLILRGDSKIIDICNQVPSYAAIRGGVYRQVFVSPDIRIDVQLFMIGSLKITATAARVLKINSACNRETEIGCKVLGTEVCIYSGLLCDGNINCGYYERYDEDPNVCDPITHTWVIGLYTMVLLIIGLVLLVQLLWFYIPRVSDNLFIFKENEENKLNLNSQMQRPLGDEHSITTIQDLEFLNKINVNIRNAPETLETNYFSTHVQFQNNAEIELKSLIYDKPQLK